jgi:hypothetical protein
MRRHAVPPYNHTTAKGLFKGIFSQDSTESSPDPALLMILNFQFFQDVLLTHKINSAIILKDSKNIYK